ncbi:MAG: transposase, partial [Chitinophagaceae bacterium]|nr:transposase [Chitinophagaceae bacterium]
FYRYSCPDCKTELVLPFSCKSRLCLSCSRKKLFGWSVNLSQILDSNLSHDHITFTIPGKIQRLLFERGFQEVALNKLATILYQKEIRSTCGLNKNEELEWKAGILTTIHKSGNSLNYNPHLHMIATRDLVNIKTGELSERKFIAYGRFRILWREALLKFLRRQKILTREEEVSFRNLYKKGFHVYFQPITGTETDILFRTAEYMATGFFHNSQILHVDHEKLKITFQYRSWMEPGSRKKRYSILTMDLYEFMARMLFYLPDSHQKSIRYYGLYASAHRKNRLELDRRACSWSSGIENSFEKTPEFCPDCGREMNFSIIYSFQAGRVFRNIRKNFVLQKGYFRPVRGP